MRISGIVVVSSIAIPKKVSLSSLRFQVSHNTSCYVFTVLRLLLVATYLNVEYIIFIFFVKWLNWLAKFVSCLFLLFK